MPHTLADLTNRADGGRFVLSVVASMPLRAGDDPQQQYMPVARGSGSNVAVSWTATYRGRVWTGHMLVADSRISSYAQGIVLDAAWTAFDGIDMRLGIYDHRSPLAGPTVFVAAPKGAVVGT